jgi:signal transduction histidine kinase
VHHEIASVATLCQTLIANDACATVVVDGDERLVAWNTAAGPAFGFSPETLRDRSMIVAGFTRGGPAIRKILDALRGQSGTQAQRVGAPDGDVVAAPLRIDDRLYGFVLRRADTAVADALRAELTVVRSQLDATRLELQTSTMELATANDALRSANEALQHRLDELQEAATADRHKDEFLAMLAHELRTPLAPILSAVQILGRLAGADPVVQRARQVVERQALHQARLLGRSSSTRIRRG